MSEVWRCRNLELRVFDRTHVMGVLNVTPDSFSDGGLFSSGDAAIKHAVEMAADGADLIDVGGESTRPGAEPVPAKEEMERVIPVIKALSREVEVPISIDTAKATVASAAIEAGAVIVNDISAMRFDPAMGEVIASSRAGVILMHMQGQPRTMQQAPHYGDVVAEVREALLGWAREAQDAGIKREQIAIDPGIGFGKNRDHNLLLLKQLRLFTSPDVDEKSDRGEESLRYPVVVGPSRKSFIGLTLDLPVEERLEGTAAAVAWVVAAGADVVRVHDVREIVRVIRMVEAIQRA
jgi:dihydropteroate synthase